MEELESNITVECDLGITYITLIGIYLSLLAGCDERDKRVNDAISELLENFPPHPESD